MEPGRCADVQEASSCESDEGPLSSLALCAWLGGADRFSSSRKAVRFVGLDITVHSCDGKRSPGRLSRQGPEVLRFLVERPWS
jgi:transposase